VLIPPSPGDVDDMVALGAADAAGWARENGLLPAAAPAPALNRRRAAA
jgi:hypothetical protein